VRFLNLEGGEVLKSETNDQIINRINDGYDLDYVFQRLPNIKARKKISPEEKRRKQENEIDEIMAKNEKDIEEQEKQRQEQEKEFKEIKKDLEKCTCTAIFFSRVDPEEVLTKKQRRSIIKDTEGNLYAQTYITDATVIGSAIMNFNEKRTFRKQEDYFVEVLPNGLE